MLPSSRGPRRVGRYLLCDQIGSGGMATIHLARLLGPQGFSRTVAVKQLHPQFAQSPQFVAMLLDEARLAVRIRHVNVVSPLDIVATDSELFIVMDYVNGESFANLLAASGGPLRSTLAAAVLVQVLLGLHAAHEATREQGEALGLVHRDVSPQNILVGQDGVARMLDFGIAKAIARSQSTDGGMVKGKLGYMAPEQIRLEPVDRRADLFSAGVVLWEALTGTGLFVADTLGASIELVLHGEIAPPSQRNSAVTPELDAVVLKALARDRDARFQDAISMAAALERATPLASALEITEWVEKLAGPGLERKADLVRRAEALSWEPAHAPAPTPAPAESRAPAERTSWSETVPVSAMPLRRTPTLLGLARPRALHIAGNIAGDVAGNAPMATAEATGVAVGADRDASATNERKGSRDWKTMGLALGIALAGSALALALLSMSEGSSETPLAVARQPLVVEPRLAVAVTASPLERPALEPSAPEPQTPALQPNFPRVRPTPSQVAPSAVLQSGPPPQGAPRSADRSDSVSSTPRARASRAAPSVRSSSSARTTASSTARRVAGAKVAPSIKASISNGGSKVESKPSREPTGSPTMAPSPSDGCTPPWIVDEQQVKVFKAECLR